jgi:lipid-A-disaccharide synthase
MGASDALLLASGTATLEAMLMKTPMVACYKVSWLSYQVFSRMIKTDYFTLPNLLAQKELVPELIQHDMSLDDILSKMKPLLLEDTSEIKQEYLSIHSNIKRNASDKAAQAIWNLVERNQ